MIYFSFAEELISPSCLIKLVIFKLLPITVLLSGPWICPIFLTGRKPSPSTCCLFHQYYVHFCC